jgi:hypothetical protein
VLAAIHGVTGIGLVVLSTNHGVTGIGLVVLATLLTAATIPRPIAAVKIDSASTAATIHLFMTSSEIGKLPRAKSMSRALPSRGKRETLVPKGYTPSLAWLTGRTSIQLSSGRLGFQTEAVNGTKVPLWEIDWTHRCDTFASVFGPIRILDRRGLHPYHRKIAPVPA